MIKSFLISLLSFVSISLPAQQYPFAKDFANGKIIFKDSTQQEGEIKWFPNQTEKLKFRTSEKGDTKKYAAEDLSGFVVDTFHFVSLSDFTVYAETYPLLGKKTKVKHTFGQMIDQGSKYNIYLVVVSGYNGMSGAIENYLNFLFEKKSDTNTVYAAFPLGARMNNKKYERAKEDLYSFFADYPQIVEKIKTNKQQDDFFQIINLVKESNR